MHAYRSHTCGALRAADAGADVRLSGWIHRKRDHGGLLFIDLRDHYGLTQLVLHPETPGFDAVERLRAESVIRVDGEVVARAGRDGEREPADRRGRGAGRAASRCCPKPPSCRCRCSASRTIRKRSASSTATSTCAARPCTATSCCARKVIASIRQRMIEQGFPSSRRRS